MTGDPFRINWSETDVRSAQIGTAADRQRLERDDIDDYYEDMLVEVYVAPAVVDDYYLHIEIVPGELIIENPLAKRRGATVATAPPGRRRGWACRL